MSDDREQVLATARAAHVRGVCVTWGLRDVAVLRAAQPDALVGTMAELATALT